jgi:hypothetical protein
MQLLLLPVCVCVIERKVVGVSVRVCVCRSVCGYVCGWACVPRCSGFGHPSILKVSGFWIEDLSFGFLAWGLGLV